MNSEVLKAIEKSIHDNGEALKSLGISLPLSDNIQKIMNKYSFVNFPVAGIIAFILDSENRKTGLLGLERFIETYFSKLDSLKFGKDFSSALASVFSASAALSSRLNADFRIVRLFSEIENPYLSRLQKEYYFDKINKLNIFSESTYSKIKNIHLVHIAELCRICSRNYIEEISVSEINYELSTLADSIIESCLDIVIEEIFSEEKAASISSFFVLGLGKLGGFELNVSSDIDLIFLSDEKQGWGSYEKMSLHTNLSNRLIQLLTEATELGYLYRVDTRLRADGSSGPIVKTTVDYIRYIELRGEAWERQMLLKARPVAGNINSGQKFLNELERFIFPTSITRSPNREVVNIKNQIESRLTAEGSKKTHLKLMPGGIRDIEFIVQCLQLLMGGKNPSVRTSSTLKGLQLLTEAGALNSGEYKILSEAYITYRRIENVLQWKELLPAFYLPESKEEIEELGSRIGMDNLEDKIGNHLSGVRSIYEDIFKSDMETFEETAVNIVLNPAENEKTFRFLENLGFNDPAKSLKTLHELMFGNVAARDEITLPLSFTNFIPKLLRELSDMPDPGGTLENFIRIAVSYNAGTAFFDILGSNKHFFDLLLSVSQGSLFVTEILEKDPSLIDWLVETGNINKRLERKSLIKELNDLKTNSLESTGFTNKCLNVSKREIMRAAVRDISGLSNQQETFSDLTNLAETIVKAVFDWIIKLNNIKNTVEFSIVAAGKLGSGIMNFGSDLDLIFVYGNAHGHGNAQEKAIKLAQDILLVITGSGGADKIYDVDMRLRPEGGNSPLAVSIEEYSRYFEKRASVWERLALVKARHLTGTDDFGFKADSIIKKFVYSRPFTHEEIQSILKIRTKMADESVRKYPGMINIKSNRGGMADIDFIAQTYGAHFGADNDKIRKQDTRGILRVLGESSLITQSESEILIENHIFLSDVEKAIRIGSGKSFNTIPESGHELLRITGLLGFRNIRKFNNRIKDCMVLTRELYERLMGELSG